MSSPDSSFLKLREHTVNSKRNNPSLFTPSLPLHLPFVLLLPGLGFHLLHFNGIRFTSAHVQVMIPHAQCQDAFVDAKTGYIENKVLKEKKKIAATPQAVILEDLHIWDVFFSGMGLHDLKECFVCVYFTNSFQLLEAILNSVHGAFCQKASWTEGLNSCL